MGRRSCHWPHVSVLYLYQSNGLLRELSYLVAKSTHSGSGGLLVDSQPAFGEFTYIENKEGMRTCRFDQLDGRQSHHSDR